MNKRHEYTVYVLLIIAIFAGSSIVFDNPTIDIEPVEVMDVMEMKDINPIEILELDVEVGEEEATPTISGQYDGEVVIATAQEVITMQIIDGVKHFTNHLIG